MWIKVLHNVEYNIENNVELVIWVSKFRRNWTFKNLFLQVWLQVQQNKCSSQACPDYKQNCRHANTASVNIYISNLKRTKMCNRYWSWTTLPSPTQKSIANISCNCWLREKGVISGGKKKKTPQKKKPTKKTQHRASIHRSKVTKSSQLRGGTTIKGLFLVLISF